MSNKIVTSVAALTDDSIDNLSDNKIVCIDLQQGFIGVHKSNPEFQIDVSGTIKCSALNIGGNLISICGDTDFGRFTRSIIPNITDNITLGNSDRYWKNAYIKDVSVNNISISENISVSGNIIPLNDITSDLGSSSNNWRHAYIRDISVANISVSGSVTIPDGTISGSKIVTATITSTQIADGTIVDGDISSNASIAFNKINATNNITNLHIATNADISGSKIANVSITSNKIDSTGTWSFTNISGNFGTIRDLSVNNSMTISGNLIPLAINNNSTLGSTTNLWRNAYIRDLSVANITVSGNILSTNNNSQVPVSYNTFSVVSAQNRTLLSYIGTASNEWFPAPVYDISKVVLSNRSFIKIEVKVNYTASPEADQTLSFRVIESFNRGISFETIPVFSDISLGSSMGVTINNIYNGSYYEDLSGVNLSENIITYRLQFRRDCPVGNTIKTPGYGIQQSTGNYISLQELYRPP